MLKVICLHMMEWNWLLIVQQDKWVQREVKNQDVNSELQTLF